MGKLNFVYEKKENELVIGNLEKWKLKNKQYFFGKIMNLEFSDEVNLYLLDTKFNYFSKIFFLNKEKKKFTMKDLEDNLKEFNLWKNRF